MHRASEAPRLGPIEILERICGDFFVSGKRIFQMPELHVTLDFSRARLKLKLLYINICSYPAMFRASHHRKATG